MKIIGVINNQRYAKFPQRYICEVSSSEMSVIASDRGDCVSGDFDAAIEVEICDRFRHAMKVLQSISEVKKLPSKLQSLSELLQIVMPSVTRIENAGDESEEDAEVLS